MRLSSARSIAKTKDGDFPTSCSWEMSFIYKRDEEERRKGFEWAAGLRGQRRREKERERARAPEKGSEADDRFASAWKEKRAALLATNFIIHFSTENTPKDFINTHVLSFKTKKLPR